MICDLNGRGGKAELDLEMGFSKFHYYLTSAGTSAGSTDINDPNLMEFYRIYQEFTPSRRFCTTDTGLMGWAPERAIVTDMVCVILGARMPYILRKTGDTFQLVGHAYLHGVMEGEAFTLLDVPMQDIVLA